MSDREAMKLALEALEWAWGGEPMGTKEQAAMQALRTRLDAPHPEPVLPEAITCGMPFVIKHYTADLRPTIKGNGFDGLEIGESREEAEEFVAWVNARIATPPAAAPDDNEALRQELAAVLSDWNSLVRASGSRTNGGAVGHVAALRRDAERYRWLLDWLVRTGLLTAQRCRIDAPETYGDWYILKKPYVVDGTALVGYGKTEDAAIDAAMKGDKT